MHRHGSVPRKLFPPSFIKGTQFGVPCSGDSAREGWGGGVLPAAWLPEVLELQEPCPHPAPGRAPGPLSCGPPREPRRLLQVIYWRAPAQRPETRPGLVTCPASSGQTRRPLLAPASTELQTRLASAGRDKAGPGESSDAPWSPCPWGGAVGARSLGWVLARLQTSEGTPGNTPRLPRTLAAPRPAAARQASHLRILTVPLPCAGPGHAALCSLGRGFSGRQDVPEPMWFQEL